MHSSRAARSTDALRRVWPPRAGAEGYNLRLLIRVGRERNGKTGHLIPCGFHRTLPLPLDRPLLDLESGELGFRRDDLWLLIRIGRADYREMRDPM